MKEDILEQITEDWLISKQSSFTKTNVKFKPDTSHKQYKSKEDNNYSDIDIMAVHLDKEGVERVSVVSCKSWQSGFDPKIWVDRLTDIENHAYNGGKIKNWKFFRELVMPKWTNAFVNKVEAETFSKSFTYYVAVTKLNNSQGKRLFENCSLFKKNFANEGAEVKIKLISFKEMFSNFFQRNNKHTLEPTIVGRLLQVIKASDITEAELKAIFGKVDKLKIVPEINDDEWDDVNGS
jgi:hypothetical protein